MAHDVEIKFEGTLNQLRDQLNSIQGHAQGWAGSMKEIFGGTFAALSFEKLVESAGEALHKITELVKDEVGEWIKAATEASEVDAQLVQAVKSTGGAAGFTAKQLADMATELEHVSTFSDEAVKSAQTLLLKFKDIKGDNFREATELAVDMAARMRTDVATAAEDLGRKLNDPTRAIQLMKREGIALTEQQESMIEALLAVGDKAAAQRIVMNELEKAYGGAAEAAANAAGGGIKQLQEQIGDIREELGQKLLDAIGDVTPALKFLAEEGGRALKRLIDQVLAFGSSFADSVGGQGVDAAEKFVGAVAIMGQRIQQFSDRAEVQLRKVANLWGLLGHTREEVAFLSDKVVAAEAIQDFRTFRENEDKKKQARDAARKDQQQKDELQAQDAVKKAAELKAQLVGLAIFQGVGAAAAGIGGDVKKDTTKPEPKEKREKAQAEDRFTVTAQIESLDATFNRIQQAAASKDNDRETKKVQLAERSAVANEKNGGLLAGINTGIQTIAQRAAGAATFG